MARSLNGSLSWLGAGLLTLSLGACIAQAPVEGDEKDTSSKEDSDGKDSDGDDKETDTDASKGDDNDDTKGNGSDGADEPGDAGDTEGDSEGEDDGQDGTISGTVVDADGEPVEGLGISVCSDSGGSCLNPVLTDDKGEYKVEGVFNSWKDFHAAVGPGQDTKAEFFAGSILSIHLEKGGVAVDAGQLTFLAIDEKDKGTSFKDVEEKKTFEAGKFSFELDAGQFEPGYYADGLDEDVDNQYFAVVEVPKDIWRKEEKEIDGKRVVSIWGLFPFGGHMKEDNTSSLKIDDDLGLDEGTEVVIFEQHGTTGKVTEIGETKVADGAIELKEGLTQFARIYIAEK